MTNPSKSLLDYIHVMVGVCRDDPRDDTQLLARFVQDRDERAFTTLLWRHGHLVWRTCTQVLGDGSEAEDAFQATFLALARKADRLRGNTLAGWLYQVARRAAVKADNGVRRQRSLELRLRNVTQPRAESPMSQTELYAALDEELAGLPERLRVPLLLHYLEGRSQVEVARLLGCARRALQKRLTQGEALLRDRLEQRGLTMGIVPVVVLLGGSTTASAVPARLISSTVRAAVAFRSGSLTGGASEAARAVLGALPSSLGTTIMQKSLWIVLACCFGLGGAGVIACRTLSARSGEPAAAGPTARQTPSQLGLGGRAAVRVDRQGDPLPEGALARLGTTRLRHTGPAMSVALAPDGKTVVTAGGHDGTVRLWEAATGKEIRNLQGKLELDRWISLVTFSLDGKTVAALGDNGKMRLWETVSGKLIRTLTLRGPERDSDSNWGVALAPDGKKVAMGEMEGNESVVVHLWEVATGREICTLKSETGQGLFISVAFSPDGKTVATGKRGNGEVSLWEAATGKKIYTLKGHNNGASRVAFSPDGKTMAVGEKDGKVYLWEAATGKEIRSFQAHKRQVWLIAFSPDGKTVATAEDIYGSGTVRLWEAATGKPIQTLQGHKACVWSMAFASDGKTVVTGGTDGTVRLWEAATGKEIRMQMGHEGPVFRVAFASDGKTVVTGGNDKTVRLWEVVTGKEIRKLNGWKEEDRLIYSVAFAPDGKTATARSDGWVRLWETATGKEIRKLKGGTLIESEVFSSDGKTLATGEQDGTIRLWRTTTGEEIRVLHQDKNDNKEGVTSVAFAPDGKTLAMGGSYGTVRLLEVATSKAFCTLQRPKAPNVWSQIISVAFSPDGKIVAMGGEDGTVRLWETATGKEIRTLRGKGRIVALAFSHDGKTLAAASDDCVQLWDLFSGDAYPRLAGHRGNVLGIAFSPDGMYLASVSADTTGLIWDLTSRTARPATKPDSKAIEALWADLASSDALRAWRAIWTLEATPAQAVPLLRNRLQPVPADAGKRLSRLVADLDADDFKVRQKAYQKLEKLGPDAELALVQGLEGNPSVEFRKRLKQLLELLKERKMGRSFSKEFLRGLRGVVVLELIGTPRAREVLKTLAAGGAAYCLTEEAQAALRRLDGARQP